MVAEYQYENIHLGPGFRIYLHICLSLALTFNWSTYPVQYIQHGNLKLAK